jgi:hypothetical protein
MIVTLNQVTWWVSYGYYIKLKVLIIDIILKIDINVMCHLPCLSS